MQIRKNIAVSYRKIATVYSQLGNYNLSEKYYSLALKEFRALKDSSKIASILRYQGYNYVDYNVFTMANKNFQEALKIDEAQKDTARIVEDLFNLGRSQYMESLYLMSDSLRDMARYTLQKAYFLDFKNLKTTMKAHILKYMVNIYTDKAFNAKTKESRKVCADSMYLFYKLLDEKRLALGLNNAENYQMCEASYMAIKGEYKKAIEMLDIIHDTMMHNEKIYNTSYNELCHIYILIYETIGDYQKALKYTNLLLEFDRKKRGQEFLVSTANNKYEEEIKERKTNELIMEAELMNQKTITYVLIGTTILGGLLIIVISQGFSRNRKNAKKLASQNIEISHQRDMLKAANSENMAALRYAQRIQRASLPEDEIFRTSFKDYFVIFKPLNIVSGDFYWAAIHHNLTFVAVADCTGHGVPGAFMSMLGISSLNDIILSMEFDYINAATILNLLKNKIIKSLHQTINDYSSKDGLDISIIIYDKPQGELQFAGAHRPLWIIQNDRFIEIKGDKQPVGIYISSNRDFTNQVLDVNEGDTIYMFSDGITDQINNPDDRDKYSTKKLKELIMTNNGYDLPKQKEIFVNSFESWRKHEDGSMEPQLDDQILMAIRL